MLEVGVEEDEEALQQQQEQLERDLFELKRRKQQVKLDKLHRQLVVQAQGELQTIEDELQVQLQARCCMHASPLLYSCAMLCCCPICLLVQSSATDAEGQCACVLACVHARERAG